MRFFTRKPPPPSDAGRSPLPPPTLVRQVEITIEEEWVARVVPAVPQPQPQEPPPPGLPGGSRP